MTDTTPPIEVNPSSIPAQLASAARIAAILIPGFATLIAFLSAKDMAGAWSWLHATDGAAFVAALGTAVALALSLYKTYASHQQKVVIAEAAPNSVAKVTK